MNKDGAALVWADSHFAPLASLVWVVESGAHVSSRRCDICTVTYIHYAKLQYYVCQINTSVSAFNYCTVGAHTFATMLKTIQKFKQNKKPS